MHQKLTKQIVGMRRGKQYDFIKIENPEHATQTEISIGK